MLSLRPSLRGRSRPHLLRGTLLCAAVALLAAPALANADNSSTLTVVGTSDVSDSGLIANLIQPEFEAAYPQYTFKYVGTATGAAISNAESSTYGASALIVHAASLENQFVAGGFSYEQYGRAIFTNDFVLAGPTGDPAGVLANASHNIVQAFADIATAGYNGGGSPLITFMSRTGSPGTVVEEHAIWALVGAMANPPAGLLLCTVSAANGGGETPIATGQGVTSSGQACPGTYDPPDWYQINNATQGPNVVLTNACTGVMSPPKSCYVFTDRGTYDYLASGNDPAGSVANLTIVTRNNAATAPGGQDLLENYFHAYIINPSKGQVNLPAAQAFLNFLTSPSFQAQLKTYLDDIGDPGGPPFVADASPIITATGIPSVDAAGAPVTVTGTVVNAEPDYPAIANQTVTLDEIEGGVPVPVASGTTNSSGAYSITFTPLSSGSYQVSTGQIAQIENSSLSPVFGDLLSPAASAPMSMSVQGAVAITLADPFAGGVVVSGGVAPAAPDANATVTLYAQVLGTNAFTQVGSESLAAGQSTFSISAPLAPNTWQVEVIYADQGQILSVTSGALTVTVPAATTPPVSTSIPAVNFKTIKLKKTALTISGKLNPAPAVKGAHVELFALRAQAVGTATKGGSGAFKKIASTAVATGKASFTLHAKLARGYEWVLQLEYVPSKTPSRFSRLRTVTVR